MRIKNKHFKRYFPFKSKMITPSQHVRIDQFDVLYKPLEEKKYKLAVRLLRNYLESDSWSLLILA